MKRYAIYPLALAAVAALALAPTTGTAQSHPGSQPPLHVNPRWKQCAFQLDATLTQSAWRRFTQEAGLVAYFRPLTDARPMGKGNYEFSILQYNTSIDDATSAWNDTFVHPDADHWLTEEGGLGFPGLTARAGITDRLDVGAYFSKNVQSNYGFAGGQLQYNLVNDAQSNWAASARASAITMFGPEDLTFQVYGMDLVASRNYTLVPRWVSVSPYVGVSGYLSSSHETTTKVNLSDERVLGGQASIGAVAQISRARLSIEYNTSRVNSTSMKIGVAF